ncbi:MAG: hypothetical protein IPI67_13035 [Myxococcales bacterium]|nr:hypothetical protein [Myxococcales bacterium]
MKSSRASTRTGGSRNLPTKAATLDVSRPFFFVILDHATRAAVFVGRVVDPSAN